MPLCSTFLEAILKSHLLHPFAWGDTKEISLASKQRSDCHYMSQPVRRYV